MKVWHPRSAPVKGARPHGVARPVFITGAIGVLEQRTLQLAMIPCRTASAQHRYGGRRIGITGASTTSLNRHTWARAESQFARQAIVYPACSSVGSERSRCATAGAKSC